MSVTGTWHVDVKTPAGAMTAVVELTETDDSLSGTATGPYETFTLIDPTLDGDKLTWTLALTKPMKLTLAFELRVDGDTFTGTAKAKLLPTSQVNGTRVTA